MQNKYQLLSTLSGDEALVGDKPTNLNTKKVKNHFFGARVESTYISSLSSNTEHTNASSSTLGSVPCEDANPISEESQIPPEEHLSQLEIEQEAWFLQTLEEYYGKLNLKEFTQKDVQDELYKSYWGQPYSEKQAAHISNVAKHSKYMVTNTFQHSEWKEEPGNGWSGPAENSSCFASTPEGTQIGPKIPVPLDKYAGHRIRQASQGLNTVQNLSPYKLRKISCWVQTGEYGMLSEIGEVFGLQKPILYPTQKCFHIFSPKTYDLLPKISGYVLIAAFVKENQSAYITFANISGKEVVVTVDSGCTTSVATSTFTNNVFQNFHKLLKDYNGKPFVTADNSELKTMGMMTIKICLGKLLFDMDLVI